MPTKQVAVRLSLKDGDTVKRALQTLGADGQKALRRIERASKPASKGLLAIRTFARGAQSEMRAFGARLGLIGQSLSGLGPAGLAASAGIGAMVLSLGAAMRAARGALAELDALDDAATQAGFGVERLQELRAAADETGVGARFLDDGLRRLTRRIGEFANSGAGPAAKALKALRIEVFDASGALRSSEVIFDQIVAKMENVESQAQRSALAAQLFGDDAGPRITLLLNQGSAGIERLTKKAREMGLVLDESVVKNASKVTDELVILEKVVSTQISSALVTLGPILVDTARLFAEGARAVAFFAEGLRGIDALSTTQLEKRLVTLNTQARDLRREIESDNFRAERLQLKGRTPAQLFLSPKLDRLDAERQQIRTILGSRENIQNFNDLQNSPASFGGAGLGKPAGGGGQAGDEQKRLERLAATYREKITPAVEKFAATLRDLEAAKRAGLLTDAEFAASTAKAREEFAQIEAAVRKAGLAISTDFRSGLTRGFAAVAEDAGNAAKQIETAVKSAFSKAEDAMVEFTKTGKLNFADLTNSILEDLTRMAIRQTIIAPLAGALGGALGGGGGGLFGNLFAQTGHSGAIVGQARSGRPVPAAAFSSAPRFHGGGFPGLQPGEVPFIAKKGEGVFTEEQMAALGGRGGGTLRIELSTSIDPDGNIVPVVRQVSGDVAARVVAASAGSVAAGAVPLVDGALRRGDLDDGMAAFGAKRQARVR